MNDQAALFEPTSPLKHFQQSGAARRDRGMARAEEVESEAWKEAAWAELVRLADAGEPFTSETLRAAVGDPSHFNVMGALFNTAARAGVIRQYGWTDAERPSRHACALRERVGVP